MVGFTPRPLYPGGSTPAAHGMGDWVGACVTVHTVEKRKISTYVGNGTLTCVRSGYGIMTNLKGLFHGRTVLKEQLQNWCVERRDATSWSTGQYSRLVVWRPTVQMRPRHTKFSICSWFPSVPSRHFTRYYLTLGHQCSLSRNFRFISVAM